MRSHEEFVREVEEVQNEVSQITDRLMSIPETDSPFSEDLRAIEQLSAELSTAMAKLNALEGEAEHY